MSKILVIDDDASVREVVSEMLRLEGHDVTIAENGREATTMLADRNFDLVITVCEHADENGPSFLGKSRVEHVGFDDPPKLAKIECVGTKLNESLMCMVSDSGSAFSFSSISCQEP